MQYTTQYLYIDMHAWLFYQDFKDTFVCNTQLHHRNMAHTSRCFIRISKILLYAIHNITSTICNKILLFYQDFKDTFVCNTQPCYATSGARYCCFIRISKILLYAIHNNDCPYDFKNVVVLSGFQ